MLGVLFVNTDSYFKHGKTNVPLLFLNNPRILNAINVRYLVVFAQKLRYQILTEKI